MLHNAEGYIYLVLAALYVLVALVSATALAVAARVAARRKCKSQRELCILLGFAVGSNTAGCGFWLIKFFDPDRPVIVLLPILSFVWMFFHCTLHLHVICTWIELVMLRLYSSKLPTFKKMLPWGYVAVNIVHAAAAALMGRGWMYPDRPAIYGLFVRIGMGVLMFSTVPLIFGLLIYGRKLVRLVKTLQHVTRRESHSKKLTKLCALFTISLNLNVIYVLFQLIDPFPGTFCVIGEVVGAGFPALLSSITVLWFCRLGRGHNKDQTVQNLSSEQSEPSERSKTRTMSEASSPSTSTLIVAVDQSAETAGKLAIDV